MNKHCYHSVLLGILLATIGAGAADHYVRPAGTCTNTIAQSPFTNWDIAATNIQWAVNAASAGETVYVTNGAYCVTNQIAVTNRIIIKSMNGYSNTLVYADWPAYTNVRCFYVVGTGVVDGFTVSNGHATSWASYGGGGGAWIDLNGVVQNCYFVNNVCSNGGSYAGGGAVFIFTSGGIVSNCLIFSNMSYKVAGGEGHDGFGGGIYFASGSVLNSSIISNYASGYYGGGAYGAGLISNCLIAGNYLNNDNAGGGYAGGGQVIDCVISNNVSKGFGGGIYNMSGKITGCSIVNNSAKVAGGVYIKYGPAYLTNCVIAGNRGTGVSEARSAGGIFMAAPNCDIAEIDSCRISNNVCMGGAGGGGVTITNTGRVKNCLICNNTNMASRGNGGGVLLGNASAVTNKPYGLINCTIVNNYSTNEGGGIATHGPSNHIVNCIIYGNKSFSNNYPDVYNTGENSNNYYHCCATNVLFAPNQGNITNDPIFMDSASGNWRLKGNSPCINSGTNQSWMTNAYDLDNRIRIRYGVVDMGAYEGIYDGTIWKGW